jgi:hypothetical protein
MRSAPLRAFETLEYYLNLTSYLGGFVVPLKRPTWLVLGLVATALAGILVGSSYALLTRNTFPISGLEQGQTVSQIADINPTQGTVQYQTLEYSSAGFIHEADEIAVCTPSALHCVLAAGGIVYYFTPVANTALRYRLILPSNWTLAADFNASVNVSGTLVTPSKWQTNLFTPAIEFDGDIVVASIAQS